jgi:hypothetical protein
MANLWGTLPDIKDIITPTAILKEQAAALQEMTKGQLTCEVMQSSNGETQILTMRLVAPALGNYRVQLLGVSHGVISYPCIFTDYVAGTGARNAPDEAAFLAFLKQVLSSEKVKTLLGQLLSQIRAVSNKPDE